MVGAYGNRHTFLLPFRLIANVARRFQTERCAQTAAALSFATLLALVPMMAVAIALIEELPFGISVLRVLERFMLSTLLPEKAGVVIAKYLGQFAQRADRMTWVGLGLLAVTALIQMLTIEHAFNAIWKVQRHRPLIKRLALHLLALVVGPLVFGGALASITFLATVSFGLIEDAGWLRLAFSQVIPFVFLGVLFGLLYWALPNRNVSRWHAGIAGTLASLAFVVMQQLFALYIVKFPAYALVYGTFAAIPIFLLWLYVSWAVIIIGALLTAEMPAVLRR